MNLNSSTNAWLKKINMQLNWIFKKFDELTAAELYSIMQLRNEVFVVEQNCVYQDADDKDQASMHLCGWDGANLVAYTRIIPQGISYTEASIGRVVTDPAARGQGLGHTLMSQAIDTLQRLWGLQPIRIGAQAHLQDFYRQHGFVTASPVYDEDGIDHVEMRRDPAGASV